MNQSPTCSLWTEWPSKHWLLLPESVHGSRVHLTARWEPVQQWRGLKMWPIRKVMVPFSQKDEKWNHKAYLGLLENTALWTVLFSLKIQRHSFLSYILNCILCTVSHKTLWAHSKWSRLICCPEWLEDAGMMPREQTVSCCSVTSLMNVNVPMM